MAEQTLFESNGVTVTTSRVQVRETTYALANITSVRSLVEPRSVGPIVAGVSFIAVSALVVWLGGVGVGLLGVFFGAICVAYFFTTKAKYWIFIGTAGSEQKAIHSNEPVWTAKVVEAINNAIIARG